MEKVCVIGLGYIGLPTSALMANRGLTVFGVDCSAKVVDTVNQGKIHIVEPHLEEFVKKAVSSGKLKAGLKPVGADAFILAVPTPFHDGKKPDLSFVEAAVRGIAPVVKEGALVVLESTSPVGATEKVRDWLKEERPDLAIDKVYFAHCPERVLPGKIVEELVSNDRIIGGVNEASTKKAVELYGKFVDGALLETDSRTAELSKLTENSFRDVNIAFANELSVICEKLGVNVWELIRLANRHPRVNVLQPGPGVGGHCIAVDPWFIVDSAPEEARLIRMARQVNDNKPYYVMAKVYAAAQKLTNPKIACLGLAFKPDIDDLRESPSLEITKTLAEKKIGTIYAVEPNVGEIPTALKDLPDVIFTDYQRAIKEADIVLLLVDHKEFKELKREALADKIVIDTRGIWQ